LLCHSDLSRWSKKQRSTIPGAVRGALLIVATFLTPAAFLAAAAMFSMAAFLAVAGTASRPALAAEFSLVPSAGIQQEYSDNIFFDTTRERHDYVTTLSGGLDLRKKSERLDLSLSGRVEPVFYLHESRLNAVDNLLRGSLRYQAAPRLTVTGNAGYIIDSRPDRDIETTGLALTSTRRHRQEYQAGGEYVLSPKDLVSLSVGYSADRYGTLTAADVTTTNVTAGFVRDLSGTFAGTKGRLNGGFTRYDMEGSTVNDYFTTAGFTRAINEKWSVSLDAGLRYTVSEAETTQLDPILPPFFFTVTRVTETNRTWGQIGQASLTYRGETATASVAAGYQLAPASGRAGTAQRTSFVFSGDHRLTYELKATFAAEYFINKAGRGQFNGVPIDEVTVRLSPGIRYEFTPDMAVDATYGFTNVDYRLNNTSAQRNRFLLRFTLQKKLFE
jgi:hypothetical protein